MSCLVHSEIGRFLRCVSFASLLTIQVAQSTPAIADDPARSAQTNAAIRQMHEEVSKLKVTVEGQPKSSVAELRNEPVLRYTDPQREFPDATLWVWSVDGRPVLFSKLERVVHNKSPRWQYCMSAVNDERLSVRFGQGIVWKSKAAALKFQTLKDQPPIAKTPTLRLTQMRATARTFRTTTTDGNNAKEEMRLLPQPILRYSSEAQSLVDGAVFAIASNGTNPDALMLIQIRKPEHDAQLGMEYGFLALTGDAVTVELPEGPTVFTHAGSQTPGDHGHWLWLVLSND